MNESQRFYAFGCFHLDADKRVLMRDGTRVPLTPKAVETLVALVENAGQLVEKRDLMNRVWPNAFVEEGNLPKNILALRKILGQWDGGLEYIETVPKRGYRFVAPVEEVTHAEAPPAKEGSNEDRIGKDVYHKMRAFWSWAAGGILILAVGIAALCWRYRHQTTLKAGDAVVIADFENHTGDPAFEDSLKLALETELVQTPFLDVLGSDKVRSALKLINHSEGERLTPAIAKEVCKYTNSSAVVTGSIRDEGNKYRIELNASNCNTGHLFATAAADAENRAVVVKTLGYVGAELRAKLGEPEDSITQYNRPLDEATSSSIEALQAFDQGEKVQLTNGAADALPVYKHATDLDPSFAVALAALGVMYGDIDNDKMQAEYTKRAFDLRSRMTQHDRFVVESAYYGGTEQLDKATAVYREWLEKYPRDHVPLINLGNIDSLLGRHAEAAALYRESLRIDPNELFAYQALILSDIRTNRLEDAVAVYNQAGAHKVDNLNLAYERFHIAFLQADQHAMEEESRAPVEEPNYRSVLLCVRAEAQEYHGRFQCGRELWAQATAVAQQYRLGTVAAFPEKQALAEAIAGNSKVALELAGRALSVGSKTAPRTDAALAIALSGDDGQAERLANEIDKENPQDTIIQTLWLPSIRAAIDLLRNRPADAINRLRPVNAYEGTSGAEGSRALLPCYLRGLAYLTLMQPKQAAAEFQTILDRRYLTLEFPTGSIAALQLGRAQAMMADKAAARQSYKEFLSLWKDADHDIPIFKQAKIEYAKLQ